MVTAIALVYATMGSSQAMKTAWIEDMLALVPPLAFLVAVRRARKRPTADHPYGFHRSTAIGHLTASVALLTVGLARWWTRGWGWPGPSTRRSARCTCSARRSGPGG